MSKPPKTTYRPDLPTFGYTEKTLCSLREPTPRRKSIPWYGKRYENQPLGYSLETDTRKWAEWHQGIENAPLSPDHETLVRQWCIQAENEALA